MAKLFQGTIVTGNFQVLQADTTLYLKHGQRLKIGVYNIGNPPCDLCELQSRCVVECGEFIAWTNREK